MRRTIPILATALVALFHGLGGCSPAAADACVADDECPAGERCRAGRCVTLGDVDEAALGDAGGDTWDGGDSTPGDAWGGDDVETGDDPTPPTCAIGPDDRVESDELPFVLDLPLHFVEASGAGAVPVDLVGVEAADGVTEWDLDQDLPGDHDVSIAAISVTDFWFAGSFDADAFVSPLDDAGEVLAVYERTAQAVLLVGVASSEEDDTVIVYDPPITVLELPVQLGDSIQTDAYGDGTFEGNPFYTSREIYDVTVDGRGRLLTPAGPFEVLRVRVRRELLLPMAVYPFWYTWLVQRQVVFVAPCYGQIAQIRSEDDEADEDFTTAALVRRISLAP